jgi:hypothetical protein
MIRSLVKIDHRPRIRGEETHPVGVSLQSPSKRGATLAVHSMLGYIGGFIGTTRRGRTRDAGGVCRMSRSCFVSSARPNQAINTATVPATRRAMSQPITQLRHVQPGAKTTAIRRLPQRGHRRRSASLASGKARPRVATSVSRSSSHGTCIRGCSSDPRALGQHTAVAHASSDSMPHPSFPMCSAIRFCFL